MTRAEPGRVPNMKLPLSSPVKLGPLLAMMCDNARGVLPTREVHLEVLLGLYYIGMIN